MIMLPPQQGQQAWGGPPVVRDNEISTLTFAQSGAL